MEQIECSETSAYINQTPGNHPKENKQHTFKLVINHWTDEILVTDICYKDVI